MKKLLSLFILTPALAYGTAALYQINPITTNTPAGMTNVILAIATNAGWTGFTNGQTYNGIFVGNGAGMTNVPTTNLVFNVRDFGALGDGVTDDHAAIALAIRAATNAPGGTVYFPSVSGSSNIYNDSTTHRIPPDSKNRRITIMGSGGAEWKFTATNGIFIQGAFDLDFIRIIGMGSTNGTSPLYTNYVGAYLEGPFERGAYVSRTYVNGFGIGIAAYEGLNQMTDSKIVACGVGLSLGSQCDAAIVERVDFYNCGIGLETGAWSPTTLYSGIPQTWPGVIASSSVRYKGLGSGNNIDVLAGPAYGSVDISLYSEGAKWRNIQIGHDTNTYPDFYTNQHAAGRTGPDVTLRECGLAVTPPSNHVELHNKCYLHVVNSKFAYPGGGSTVPVRIMNADANESVIWWDSKDTGGTNVLLFSGTLNYLTDEAVRYNMNAGFFGYDSLDYNSLVDIGHNTYCGSNRPALRVGQFSPMNKGGFSSGFVFDVGQGYTNRFRTVGAAQIEADDVYGRFYGSGSGLTNLSASELRSGTVANALLDEKLRRFTTNVAWGAGGTRMDILGQGELFEIGNNGPSGASLQIFQDNPTNMDSIIYVSGSSNDVITAYQNIVELVALKVYRDSEFLGSLTGNGSGLTNLNASELRSGTVPNAVLPVNLTNIVLWGDAFGTNKTYTDATGWHNTNNNGGAVNISAGAITASGGFTNPSVQTTNFVNIGWASFGALGCPEGTTGVSVGTNGTWTGATTALTVYSTNRSQARFFGYDIVNGTPSVSRGAIVFGGSPNFYSYIDYMAPGLRFVDNRADGLHEFYIGNNCPMDLHSNRVAISGSVTASNTVQSVQGSSKTVTNAGPVPLFTVNCWSNSVAAGQITYSLRSMDNLTNQMRAGTLLFAVENYNGIVSALAVTDTSAVAKESTSAATTVAFTATAATSTNFTLCVTATETALTNHMFRWTSLDRMSTNAITWIP